MTDYRLVTVPWDLRLTFYERSEDLSVASGVQAQAGTIQIPAGTVVLGVATRVLVQPGGTTAMSLRGTVTDHQFNGDDIPTDADSTDPGTNGCPFYDGPGETLRYVFDAPTTDGAGSIRCTAVYYVVTPPS